MSCKCTLFDPHQVSYQPNSSVAVGKRENNFMQRNTGLRLEEPGSPQDAKLS
jgi:hypothetical protein